MYKIAVLWVYSTPTMATANKLNKSYNLLKYKTITSVFASLGKNCL